MTQETLIQWSEGNPGAAVFLANIASSPNIISQSIFLKLSNLKSIRGTNLYVLYSDLCDKDLKNVVKLLSNCPADILQDACSRQDYSGQELVKEYLK